MKKSVLVMLFAAIFIAAFTASAAAQKGRKSVTGAEVTGTFQYKFAGKFRGSASVIEILALGGGKVKIGFDLIYPHLDGQGNLTANLGKALGTADIEGDTAIYRQSDKYGKCKITIKFVRPGTIKVDQDATESDCGFGQNVQADGTYRKTSGRKPKFDLGM